MDRVNYLCNQEVAGSIPGWYMPTSYRPIGFNISFRQKYFYSQNGDMHMVLQFDLIGAALFFATQMLARC